MTEMNKEYGVALFALAKEQNKENEYALSLECVEEVVKANPLYLDFLSSPSIPLGERLDAIDKAFGTSLPEDVVSFIKLLCEKGRIRSLTDCITQYKTLLDIQNSISTAYIKSAVELTEEQKQKLKDKLEIKCGHSVILECSQDESLMGGIVVEIDGKVIDGSLSHRLYEVKDVISK